MGSNALSRAPGLRWSRGHRRIRPWRSVSTSPLSMLLDAEADPDAVCFGLTVLTQRFLTLTLAKSAGSARDE